MSEYNYEKEVLKASKYFKIPLYSIPKSKQTRAIVLEAVKQHGENLNSANIKFYKDREIIETAINSGLIEYNVSGSYDDFKYFELYLDRKNYLKKIINENLKNEKKLIEILSLHNGALAFVPKSKQNFNIVLAAVKKHGLNLCYAKKEFTMNREIAFEAIQNDGVPDVNKKTIDKDFDLWQYTSKMYHNRDFEFTDWSDKKEVLKQVRTHGALLFYATDKLKKDSDIVKAAVKSDGISLKYADNKYSQKKQFVLLAVKSNPKAIEFVNKKFLNDPEVILATVKKNGIYLINAGLKLKKNEKIILEAVKSNPHILRFFEKNNVHGFDSRLLKNEEFLIKCVKKNGDVIFSIREFDYYYKPEKFNKKLIKAALKAGCNNYIYEHLGLYEGEPFWNSLSEEERKIFENIENKKIMDDKEYLLEELSSERFRDVIYDLKYFKEIKDKDFVIQIARDGYHCNCIYDYMPEYFRRDPEIMEYFFTHYKPGCLWPISYNSISEKLLDEIRVLSKKNKKEIIKNIDLYKGKDRYFYWDHNVNYKAY